MNVVQEQDSAVGVSEEARSEDGLSLPEGAGDIRRPEDPVPCRVLRERDDALPGDRPRHAGQAGFSGPALSYQDEALEVRGG